MPKLADAAAEALRQVRGGQRHDFDQPALCLQSMLAKLANV